MIKRLAIIPARGGSKRIKNKNLKNFFGKPLIYYSILAAKKSKIFSEIHVSADSKKILKYQKLKILVQLLYAQRNFQMILQEFMKFLNM